MICKRKNMWENYGRGTQRWWRDGAKQQQETTMNLLKIIEPNQYDEFTQINKWKNDKWACAQRTHAIDTHGTWAKFKLKSQHIGTTECAHLWWREYYGNISDIIKSFVVFHVVGWLVGVAVVANANARGVRKQRTLDLWRSPENMRLFLVSNEKKTTKASRCERREILEFHLASVHSSNCECWQMKLVYPKDFWLRISIKCPLHFHFTVIILFCCSISYEWILNKFASDSSVCLLHTRTHTLAHLAIMNNF